MRTIKVCAHGAWVILWWWYGQNRGTNLYAVRGRGSGRRTAIKNRYVLRSNKDFK